MPHLVWFKCRRPVLLGLLALVLVPSTAGCREAPPSGQAAASPGAGTATDAPLKVVCTIGMITDVVRNIGGPRVEVTGLMGEHVDPHLYKATPADHRALSAAEVIFYGGLHLEGKMADLFVQMARKKPVYAVTQDIDPSKLREPPEFEGQFDPHVWFDVSLWQSAVGTIRDGLSAVRPAWKDEFAARAADYTAKLDELHDWCRLRIASLPVERRVLVTAHDAFGYFGRAYGMEVLAIQGISTESEAALKKINDLVDTLVARKIPAVFIESSVNPRTIQALIEGCKARGHVVRIGGELFSDAMGAAGTTEGTYIGMVRHNVETIVKALQ
ncbi:MAG: manganese transporter [Phycisphaerae bacterium]|nr:MAG: zinc ABC transporter substrate-binding protein [Planctomycetia bacterium]RIK71272.1 MAG: manganese transporter [Planctomycetota bacterium]GJQ26386.1 MAG: manganese transporter [Phycisphaerae bacterium]